MSFFFFQAEDGIRDLVRSRGLGDVYKRQEQLYTLIVYSPEEIFTSTFNGLYKRMLEKMDTTSGFELLENNNFNRFRIFIKLCSCLLYTSDAADERSSVDLGGRRIIKKKKNEHICAVRLTTQNKKTNAAIAHLHKEENDTVNQSSDSTIAQQSIYARSVANRCR